MSRRLHGDGHAAGPGGLSVLDAPLLAWLTESQRTIFALEFDVSPKSGIQFYGSHCCWVVSAPIISILNAKGLGSYTSSSALILLIVSFFELFFVMDRVDRFNDRHAQEIVDELAHVPVRPSGSRSHPSPAMTSDSLSVMGSATIIFSIFSIFKFIFFCYVTDLVLCTSRNTHDNRP